MKIRKAKRNDFEWYYLMEQEFVIDYQKVSEEKLKMEGRHSVKKVFDNKFGKNKLFYVAVLDNNLVGYISGSLEKYWSGNSFCSAAYIDNIYVQRNYRNKEIGTKLIKKFIDSTKNKVKVCKLHVDLKNKNAIKLYKRLGFKPIKILMKKYN